MGLFSNEIRTYVSSTAYNLAGDVSQRPHFVQTAIMGSIITGRSADLSESITVASRSSSALRQRRFFNWAVSNYTLGMPTAIVDGSQKVDHAAAKSGMETLITLGSNDSLRILSARIDTADVDYWAEDWVRVNHPTLLDGTWSAYLDTLTDEMVIELPGPIIARVAAPADLLWGVARADHRQLLFASYRVVTLDTQTGLSQESATAFFTYRMGSGNVALDALANTGTPLSEFYPALPLRLHNDPLGDLPAATVDTVTKAYKKLTGFSVDALLAEIESNPSVDDIDHAFLVQGVSLNSPDKSCRKYLYKFFQDLKDMELNSYTDFVAYAETKLQQEQSSVQWERWYKANVEDVPLHPLYGDSLVAYLSKLESTPSVNELRIHATALPEFDMRIRWMFIRESQHSGNARTFDGVLTRGMAKVGEYFSHQAGDRFYLFHQHSKYGYSKLEVAGLEHKNYVYGAHAVSITSAAAMADAEETGFLIPLHYPTLKNQGLLGSAQLSTGSSYLVLNSYTNVTVRWYQKKAFRILLTIAIAVGGALLFPGALGGSGILGSHASVGAYLGVTNVTAAVMVGSVVNTITAMVVSQIIKKASISVFGEKAGAVIGTVATFVAMSYGGHYANHGNFDVNWSEIFKAENLLNLTNSVSNAYTQWLNADTSSIYSELQRTEAEYSEDIAGIEKLAEELLSVGSGLIDPLDLTDATEYFGESSNTFLNRTLLTGSEIAELSFSLITDFAEISLELPSYTR